MPKAFRPGEIRLEVLVEEESALRLLQPTLRGWVGKDGIAVKIHRFQGRPDLLGKLPSRLRGYADARQRQRVDYRIVVLVDRDEDDCAYLKTELEKIARRAGLVTRAAAAGAAFNVVNRVAVRELENWYFGDWQAVRDAFPSVQPKPPAQYRNQPDAAGQKTSDAFARSLRRAGIGLTSKPGWAERIAPHLEPDRNASASFRMFIAGVRELVQQ